MFCFLTSLVEKHSRYIDVVAGLCLDWPILAAELYILECSHPIRVAEVFGDWLITTVGLATVGRPDIYAISLLCVLKHATRCTVAYCFCIDSVDIRHTECNKFL